VEMVLHDGKSQNAFYPQHLGLMMAIASARVEFEQHLGSEIHLLIETVAPGQVAVDSVTYQHGSAGNVGSARVQWRVLPNGDDAMHPVSGCKDLLDSIVSRATAQNTALGNTRWLRSVDPRSVQSSLKRIDGKAAEPEDEGLPLPQWAIYALAAGGGTLFCCLLGCCWYSSRGSKVKNAGFQGGMGGHSGSRSFSGGGYSQQSSSRRQSRSSHSRFRDNPDDDDEIDLLTGGIEMSSSSGGLGGSRGGSRRKGDNFFGV